MTMTTAELEDAIHKLETMYKQPGNGGFLMPYEYWHGGTRRVNIIGIRAKYWRWLSYRLEDLSRYRMAHACFKRGTKEQYDPGLLAKLKNMQAAREPEC